MVRKLSETEFHAALKARGVPREHLAFKCVSCGTVQSLASFFAAGVAPAQAERAVGFACVGRFVQGQGCNWTLGGLFQVHEVEIVDAAGVGHPAFAQASVEEERALMARLGAGYGDAWFPGDASAVQLFTIYEHPRDVPDGFVVRRAEVHADGSVRHREGRIAPTLDAARGLIPAGCVSIGRSEGDDPVIAEVWL